MSNYSRMHVINESDKPLHDFFNGMAVLFQPDQDKREGTFGLERVPAEEASKDPSEPHTLIDGVSDGNFSSKALVGTILKMIKISDDRASNVTVTPPGYVESNLGPDRVGRGKPLHGLKVAENHLSVMEAQITDKRASLAALTNEEAEVDGIMAALQIAASETENPAVREAMEKLEGIRSRATRGGAEPVRPAPPMPESRRGGKRK